MPPLEIRARDLAWTYAGARQPALRDLDLEVEPGSLLLVVGPSGSGKSTLARGLAGLLPRDQPGTWTGSLQVGEANVSAGIAPGLDVGIVFQDPASQLVMERAGDDVAFGLENRRWPLAEMREVVPQALAAVGLQGFDDRRSNELSGGEQQRLALAGVLAPGPSLLVLDEPTANLDPPGAAGFFARLEALRRSRSVTIVLIEHRTELAWALADRVLALDALGRPIDAGRPQDVLERSGAAMAREGIWLPSDRGAGSGLTAIARPQDATSRAPETTARSRGATAEPQDAAPEEPLLRVDAVRFAFDPAFPVLRDVGLAVAQGERVALVGPNGSGKTTLLRLAAGLLRPTAGRVRLAGEDPARMAPRRISRLVGYVVQDPELGFIGATVADELVAGLPDGAMARTFALADRLGLSPGVFGDRSPYRLSGGEQRRLSLVTALARRPRLLALDEPTYGQDRRGHEALVAAIDELLDTGTALVAATHDERFVRDVASRRVELAEGWVVADDDLPATAPSRAPSPATTGAQNAEPEPVG